MKPKQTIILFLVVAALVAGIGVYELVIKPGQVEKGQEESLFFPDFAPDQADKLTIARGDTATVLKKQGDNWVVETADNYPADEKAVETALDTLGTMEGGILASRTEEGREELGFTDSALSVTAYSGEEALAELLVGNKGKSYGSSFAMAASAENAYLVSEDLENIFGKGPSKWRNKDLFDADLEDVTEVVLTEWDLPGDGDTAMVEEGTTTAPPEPSRVSVITRDGDTGDWLLVSAGDTAIVLDKSKTDSALRKLVSLTASEFADDMTEEEAGLTIPRKQAVFTVTGGVTNKLLVGKEEDSNVYVKKGGSDFIIKVYDYNLNGIFKTEEELMPEEEGEGEMGDFDPGSLLPAPGLAPPSQGVVPGVDPVPPAPEEDTMETDGNSPE